MHTVNTDGASQELSEEGLSNSLNDTGNRRHHESMEEAGQPCRWESLWAEAYRTIKNDPEYSHLLESFEKYLRKAEHGMYLEETPRSTDFHCNEKADAQ